MTEIGGNLCFAIVMGLIVIAWLINALVNRHDNQGCYIEEPDPNAPPEVWVAYYDAVARTNEQVFKKTEQQS